MKADLVGRGSRSRMFTDSLFQGGRLPSPEVVSQGHHGMPLGTCSLEGGLTRSLAPARTAEHMIRLYKLSHIRSEWSLVMELLLPSPIQG